MSQRSFAAKRCAVVAVEFIDKGKQLKSLDKRLFLFVSALAALFDVGGVGSIGSELCLSCGMGMAARGNAEKASAWPTRSTPAAKGRSVAGGVLVTREVPWPDTNVSLVDAGSLLFELGSIMSF